MWLTITAAMPITTSSISSSQINTRRGAVARIRPFCERKMLNTTLPFVGFSPRFSQLDQRFVGWLWIIGGGIYQIG